MNSGYSADDADMLVELAQDILRYARGQHEELTREVASIHRVLVEMSTRESVLLADMRLPSRLQW